MDLRPVAQPELARPAAAFAVVRDENGRPDPAPDLPPVGPDLPVPGDPVAPDVYPDPMPDPLPVPPQDPQETPPGEIVPPVHG